MTKQKLLFTAIALCAGAFAHAGVIGVHRCVELCCCDRRALRSAALTLPQSTYNFGNGMTYANLAGQSDRITHTGDLRP